jgi:hypothetical protein
MPDNIDSMLDALRVDNGYVFPAADLLSATPYEVLSRLADLDCYRGNALLPPLCSSLKYAIIW